MELKAILVAMLLSIGCLFIVIAAIGIVRFPGFFERLHPASMGDTIGQVFILAGLIIYDGFTLISLKIFIVIAIILIANPTACLFLSRSADVSGVSAGEELKDLEEYKKQRSKAVNSKEGGTL